MLLMPGSHRGFLWGTVKKQSNRIINDSCHPQYSGFELRETVHLQSVFCIVLLHECFKACLMVKPKADFYMNRQYSCHDTLDNEGFFLLFSKLKSLWKRTTCDTKVSRSYQPKQRGTNGLGVVLYNNNSIIIVSWDKTRHKWWKKVTRFLCVLFIWIFIPVLTDSNCMSNL